MPVIKNDYPVLEYDTSKIGIIKPNKHGRSQLPDICIVTFHKAELEHFAANYKARIVNCFNSGVRKYPIYQSQYLGVNLCLTQAVPGSALSAMLVEYLMSYGVVKIILSGGCGVLVDMPEGELIVPTSVLRDEGVSYHYLPPSREIEIDRDVVSLIKETLSKNTVCFVESKVWSTDGFFRETRDMINYRKEEGCTTVEMECAAMAAAAKFRGGKFGAILYAGDTLADFDHYDEREWVNNEMARKVSFSLSLEIAVKLVSL